MAKRREWRRAVASLAVCLALLGLPMAAAVAGNPASPEVEIRVQASESVECADFTDREIRAEAMEQLAAAKFDELHAPADDRQASIAAVFAFSNHMIEGRRIFRERGPFYAIRSQGASRKITRRVTQFQRLFLPLAYLVDRRAHRFQRRGIPIVKADLMPVVNLPDPETPPKWRGRLAPDSATRLAAELREFKNSFRARVKAADFAGAATVAHQALRRIRDLETRERCHLAMTAHFLESLGLCALHADRYARASGGETISLSKAFLGVQLLPFGSALAVDLEGQELHARGIGILVNDVPAIPFEQEYNHPGP